MKNLFSITCVSLALAAGHVSADPSQRVPTAYERAAEAAWDSVLNAEDKERFTREVESAAAVAGKREQAEQESVTDRARQLLTDARQIQQVTEQGVRGKFGFEDTEPESALEEMLKPGTTYIFVSQGMPEQVLVSLLAAYEDNEDHSIEIVFRGLEKDQRTIPQMMRSVGELIHRNNLKPSVNIGLNPTVFNHFGITAVPTIVHVLPDGSTARMQGVLNLEYFFSELKRRNESDLGVHGTLYEISERDLLEIIQERLAAIDWESKKESAQKRYWENYDYQNLPAAFEPATFYADMRIQVTEDIITPDGQVIARAGDIVDPGHYLPAGKLLHPRILAINPNSTSQVQWAREQVKEAHAINEMPLVMLSELNRGEGANTLFAVEEQLQVRIFLLVPEVVQRFGIRALPASVVRSEDYPHAMLVRQWHCDDLANKCVSAPKPTWEDE